MGIAIHSPGVSRSKSFLRCVGGVFDRLFCGRCSYMLAVICGLDYCQRDVLGEGHGVSKEEGCIPQSR